MSSVTGSVQKSRPTVSKHGKRTPRKRSWFPPQHGAWAFIGLPVALGLLVSTWTPLLAAAGIAAVAAFPFSHFVTAVIRYPRKKPYVAPLLLWGTLSLIPAVAVLALRPALIVAGPVLLAAFAGNVWLSTHGADRSLTNDLLFSAECCAVIPIMWAIGATAPGWDAPPWTTAEPTLWAVTFLCALVLAGSTLHVKSLIREKENRHYRTWSTAFAAGSLPLACAADYIMGGTTAAAVMLIPFGYLLVRCLVLRDKPLKPGVLGMIELTGFILLICSVAVAA